jgi:hypothetical protein
VISGHHHHADSGRAASPHGVGDLRPGRVHLPRNSKEHARTLQPFEPVGEPGGTPGKHGDGDGPEGVRAHSRRGGLRLGALRRPRAPGAATQRQNRLGSAFDHDPELRSALVLGGHELQAWVEGEFSAAGPLGADSRGIHPSLHRHGEQCGLRRIPQRTPARPSGLRRKELGVVAEDGGLQQHPQPGVRARGDRLAALDKPSLRRVALPRHPDLAVARQPQRPHRHLVASQRPGLVRADDGGGTKRLHGGEPPNHRSLPRHPLHADRQGNGHRHRKAFRDHADGLRDGHQKHLPERKAADHPNRQDRREKYPGPQGERASKLSYPGLQRRGGGFSPGRQPRDAADLRGAAGGHHERPARAADHVSAREEKVHPLREGRFQRQRLGGLRHRQRFSRQQRLGGGHCRALDQPGVRPYRIAGGELQEIARDKVRGFDLLLHAVPHNARLQTGQPSQGAHGAFCAAFLERAHDRVHHHHPRDDRRIPRVSDRQGNDGRQSQKVNQGAFKLSPHQTPHGRADGFRKGVRPVAPLPLPDLRLRQPARGVSVQLRQGLLQRQGMPRRRRARTVPPVGVPVTFNALHDVRSHGLR